MNIILQWSIVITLCFGGSYVGMMKTKSKFQAYWMGMIVMFLALMIKP